MRQPHTPAVIDHELLAHMGLRIEGPGAEDAGELAGCYWWTWHRDGWSGIECGAHHPAWEQAALDAWQALWSDEDSQAELRAWAAGRGPRTPGAMESSPTRGLKI